MKIEVFPLKIYMYILAFNYDKGWICAQRVEIRHWLNLHKISQDKLEAQHFKLFSHLV